ncbi:MAG: hypothetical protein ACQR33_05475 [Candidatus Saccharibacteria bacterium]
MFKQKRFIDYTLIVVGLFLFIFVVAKAVAQDVTQGYLSDVSLQPGIIVQLKPHDATRVQPLSQVNETSMLGVVVSPNDSPVALSNSANQLQTYVATYGQYDVLVSTQNGVIKAGDTIAISSLDGVGMKSDSNREAILGKAVEGFDGKSSAQSTATLSGSGGKQTVAIGRIMVNINVAHNPAYHPVIAQAGVPTFLSQAAQFVTDKPVGAARIYASLTVLITSVVIAGILLYSGVRTSMTAIGRNPLAKSSIMRNLLQIVLIGMIILIIGLIAVYLLLKI